MAKRITEADLVLPALLCIEGGNPELSTTQLQQCLRALLQPRGEDLEILAGRKDDKFSQKVRNLRSHETLESPGWATYSRRGNNGYWQLTNAGIALLDDHRELIDGVLAGRFPYDLQQRTFQTAAKQRSSTSKPRRRALIFDEDEAVTEGRTSQVATQRRERSQKLRRIAREHFRDTDGRLACAACAFDFHAAYGERGDGYIEIHHRKPIFTYDDSDMEQSIGDAIENLVPLCANCHRMLHRRRDDVWTVDQLRRVLADTA